jgi:hypothetical protein
MAVQIYQNEELNDLMFQVRSCIVFREALDEWNMDNQLGFVQRAETPIPYPHINNSMEITFKTLCPRVEDFRKYNKTPIPLDVLKQISLSVNDKHFQTIEIWYDDKTPDPFAVGITSQFYAFNRKYEHLKNSDGVLMLFSSKSDGEEYCKVIGFDMYGIHETNITKYLIARWADVMRPLSELKELAKERLIEKYGAEIKNTIENSTQALKNINENALLYLSGEITESELKGSSIF